MDQIGLDLEADKVERFAATPVARPFANPRLERVIALKARWEAESP